jgi:hypothetical protein
MQTKPDLKSRTREERKKQNRMWPWKWWI